MNVFGLDIGGSAIKGALVDASTGEMLTERVRIKTPQPSTSEAVLETCAEVVSRGDWSGPVGCGFPGVVKGGVIQTSANLDDSNIGFDLRGELGRKLGSTVQVVNDADAAGLAEVRWGAGRDADGVVLMLTLGTGIGSALFVGGHLMPNTELGHLEIGGHDAETRAADSARKRENLGWKQYAERLDEYVTTVERLFWPDLIVVGGGISKKAEKFLPHLTARTKIVPAKMQNEAGIAGAALSAIPEGSTYPAHAPG